VSIQSIDMLQKCWSVLPRKNLHQNEYACVHACASANGHVHVCDVIWEPVYIPGVGSGWRGKLVGEKDCVHTTRHFLSAWKKLHGQKLWMFFQQCKYFWKRYDTVWLFWDESSSDRAMLAAVLWLLEENS
jgi:hypothetical protein